MHKKKLFKTILLIGIILLAVGCALASCKKTKALAGPEVQATDLNYRGILTIISGKVGEDIPGFFDATGEYMPLETGSTLDELNIRVNYDYCAYLYTIESDSYTHVFLINMYDDALNNRTNIQYAIFNEDVVSAIYTDTIEYNQYLAIFFNPGMDGFDNNVLIIDKFVLNNRVQDFQPIVTNERTFTILNENYIDGLNTNPSWVYYGWHYNLLLNALNFDYREVGGITGENLMILFNTYGLNKAITPGYNQMISWAYDGGYIKGFNEGYLSGGNASAQEAYQEGYNYGYDVGLNRGEQIGYNRGYNAGMQGENAISSFINILTSIFTGIGAIFSIELFPHITIGLFLLVPLFFGVLGLILWIWRHN